jgi:hypothetical protein
MICTKCKQDLPEDKFYLRKDRIKPMSWCKECKRKYDYSNNQSNLINRRLSKTKCDHKTRMSNSLTRLKDKIRNDCYNYLKRLDSIELNPDIGLTPTELKDYITQQFYPNPTTGEPMTWENHGNGPGKWQIDHIVNLASAESETDMLIIAHYSNLRPLWWEEHLVKTKAERKGN